MAPTITDNTIEQISQARAGASREFTKELVRAGISVSDDLIATDLQPVVKMLPIIETPLAGKIRRVPANGGAATAWKAVTKVNTGKHSAGVEEGKRGGNISVETKNYSTTFKGIGLENFATMEAGFAGKGYADPKAIAVNTLMMSVRREEERTDFGGNRTILLGTPVTPVVAEVATGGSIANGVDVYVSVVALTSDGYIYGEGDEDIDLPGEVTRTNADIGGSTTVHGGYNSQISAAGNLTTSLGTATHSVRAYTTPIAGAVAYAWFWGPTAGAGQVFGSVTTIASDLLTVAVGAGTGTQDATDAAVADDYSTNALIWDGMISLIAGAGPESGASSPAGYVIAHDQGTPGTGYAMTADGAGGIAEIDTDLSAIYANSKCAPDEMYMNAQELGDITKKIVAGGAGSLFRFNLDASAMATAAAGGIISAGTVLGTYLNKYAPGGGKLTKVILHPTCPPGMIMYMTWQLTISLPGIIDPLLMMTRADYYQMEWPKTQRRFEYGVYMDGALVIYYPVCYGFRHNIGTG